ncbi:MAG: hypothetical protein KGL93_10060 [Gemmatimonadota bacterium]|nr:hypothetical protein [Gemmatimonadota bacterium]
MSRTLLRVGLLALAFALGTYAFGWMAVPVVGLVWGALAGHSRRPALHAGVAAAAAWAALLLVPALTGLPTLTFATRLAAAIQVPGWALWLAELVFPLLTGWAGALLGTALAPRRPAAPAAE